MAEGREAALWKHTSAVLATLFNAHRGPDTAAVSPSDLDPYYEAPPRPRDGGAADVPITVLKRFLPSGGD